MNAQESTSRLCVVTGASEGLGRALVHLLAEDGYRVLAVARRKQALDDLAREAPEGSVVPVAADLETPEGITSIVDALRANGGSLRMLVNNAGRGDIGPFAEADTGVLRSILRLNVEGLTILTRALIDAIESGGTILNVASVASVLPGPWMATYYASKSYVLSLGASPPGYLGHDGVSGSDRNRFSEGGRFRSRAVLSNHEGARPGNSSPVGVPGSPEKTYGCILPVVRNR
ncbi:MAG: SDR family NAD(P)-dependent oxidoreductase [Spirochaetota bacterium]